MQALDEVRWGFNKPFCSPYQGAGTVLGPWKVKGGQAAALWRSPAGGETRHETHSLSCIVCDVLGTRARHPQPTKEAQHQGTPQSSPEGRAFAMALRRRWLADEQGRFRRGGWEGGTKAGLVGAERTWARPGLSLQEAGSPAAGPAPACGLEPGASAAARAQAAAVAPTACRAPGSAVPGGGQCPSPTSPGPQPPPLRSGAQRLLDWKAACVEAEYKPPTATAAHSPLSSVTEPSFLIGSSPIQAKNDTARPL